MAWTTPPTESAGAALAAADLNIIRDDLNYLKDRSDALIFSGVRVDRNASNQSIPDSTWTAVSFTRELIDQGGWIAVTSTTITVPSGAIPTGYTTVVIDADMYATFAANTTGIRKARVLRNGSMFVQNGFSAASADTTDLVGSMWTSAAATDTITMEVYQSSGGSLNLTGVALGIKVDKPLA